MSAPNTASGYPAWAGRPYYAATLASRASRLLAAILLLSAALTAQAETRILLVGDSWAAGMFLFQSFDKALADSGEEVTVAGAATAIGGSRADQWAANDKGKLDTLAKALADPPEIVAISLGGNDLLRAALEGRILTEEDRTALFAQVTRDLGTLLDAIRAGAPEARVVLIGYDYLDPARMEAAYGNEFPEAVTEDILDLTLEGLEDAREALAAERDGVDFVRNLGLMRETYGEAAPDAMPDGVHPTPEAYAVIAKRLWDGVLARP